MSDFKFEPLGDRVIIKTAEVKQETASGLIIPEAAKEKLPEGHVVAVGPGRYGDDGRLIPMIVMVGNKVLYGKYAGTEIKIDDVPYLIMSQDDILGILR